MNWQFSLIDRNGITTIIDEPIGWDNCEIDIKRDLDMHGVFFSYQGNDFEFVANAMHIIKDEYEQYGIEGNIILVIEQACDDGSYNELYRGNLVFSKYEFTCSDECYVKIPVETSGDIMDLKNRFGQQVDLQTTLAFDGETNLDNYDKLGLTISLPSKGVLLQNISTNPALNIAPVNCVPANDNAPNSENGMIEICGNMVAGEIGGFNVNSDPQYTTAFISAGSQSTPIAVIPPAVEGSLTNSGEIQVKPTYISPLVNYADGMPNFGQVNSTVDTNIRVKGRIHVLDSDLVKAVYFFFCRLPGANSGDSAGDYEWISMQQISAFTPGTDDLHTGDIRAFDVSYINSTLTINEGDRLYLFLHVYTYRTSAEINTGDDAWQIEFDPETSVTMKTLSTVAPSDAKVFMVNEAFSRIAEAITNNKIKAYSEYFGRTDAQPYTTPEDGCGSLEAITMGLFIRGLENRVAGQTFALPLSLQNMFDGLKPIHNIGWGIEADRMRAGYNRMRIEPWKFFYTDDVIMTCDAIASLTKSAQEGEYYSTFEFGYNKWEAEEYNGIDEFLTKRQYRTSLSQVSNDFSKISKFLASGYAIEVTRRHAADSTDWRYDNDVFIFCLQRSGGNLIIELGNINSPENIIDPATIYNYRISPIRIALRWLDVLLKSYKQLTSNSKLIFMSGDGNYFAAGMMESDVCRLEDQSLTENEELSTGILADATAATPLIAPERIEYEYPMSVEDFKNIMENPKGLIHYISGCEEGDGWIDTISYKPESGLATFTLIPKYQQ